MFQVIFIYFFSRKKKKEKGKSMSKRSFSFVSSSFLVLRGHHQQINPMFSFFFSCVSWSRFRQCGNYPGPRYADEEPYLPLSQVPSVRRPIDIGLDLIASAGNKQFTGIFLLPRSGGQLCVQLRVKGTYLVLSKLSLSKLLKLAYNEKNKLKFHDFSLIFI